MEEREKEFHTIVSRVLPDIEGDIKREYGVELVMDLLREEHIELVREEAMAARRRQRQDEEMMEQVGKDAFQQLLEAEIESRDEI